MDKTTKKVDTIKKGSKEDIYQALARIQRDLKASKNQHNDFSNFDYRSCEDILEAVKPLLRGCYLVITDDIKMIGERYYVKATAKLSDGDNSVVGYAYARETEGRKGMDESQITGSTSSYARKYALNGLFAIDDARDADAKHAKPVKTISSFVMQMKKGLTKDNIEDWEGKIKKVEGYSDENKAVLMRKLEQFTGQL